MSRLDLGLRAYVDANVILQAVVNDGSNPTAAALVTVTAGEMTLVDLYTSETSVKEVQRNLTKFRDRNTPKEGAGAKEFLAELEKIRDRVSKIIERSITVVPDPTADDLSSFEGMADPKDVVHLACAVQQDCTFLITENVKDFDPGHESTKIIRAGGFVRLMRSRIRGV